ncbi:potassium transporter TrkA [Candidatus Halobonum tyrrellensis]|uniref:potassium transporter TrkA n=1 Tax=Candidatus Halobonum tyrrellensis TaxID=1431545 RepID=UPI001F4253DD|nr:potassium transporter TrkA [Candidatus Halobonum tyrrellensis]
MAPVASVVSVASVVDPAAVPVVGVRRVAVALFAPVGQTGQVDATLAVRAARVLGFATMSFLMAAVAALGYRWYVREPVPGGLAVLVGVAGVAFYLNTVGLLGELLSVVQRQEDFFTTANVLTNTATLAVAALAAPLGRRAGDGFARNVVAVAGADRVDGEVGRLVRTVGRVVTVTLPEEIETLEGYDPVPEATVERLAGATLILPRRPADASLRERLTTRLKEDYGVSYVDVDLTGGDVSYLAVGQRVAGLGPTLGPGTCAVPVRADPANGASVGDVVQVWTTASGAGADHADGAGADSTGADGSTASAGAAGGADADADGARPERVATGELRATAGDVVTLAVDEADAAALSADREYRLLTLPTDPRVDREFASLLRAAAETMGVVTVGGGSDLVGAVVGDLPGTVVAVRPAAGSVDPLPRRDRRLAAGDALYVVARPDAIRDLEARAGTGADDPPADGASRGRS